MVRNGAADNIGGYREPEKQIEEKKRKEIFNTQYTTDVKGGRER